MTEPDFAVKNVVPFLLHLYICVSFHQEIVEVFKVIIVDQIIGLQPKPWHPKLQVLQIVKVVKCADYS